MLKRKKKSKSDLEDFDKLNKDLEDFDKLNKDDNELEELIEYLKD